MLLKRHGVMQHISPLHPPVPARLPIPVRRPHRHVCLLPLHHLLDGQLQPLRHILSVLPSDLHLHTLRLVQMPPRPFQALLPPLCCHGKRHGTLGPRLGLFPRGGRLLVELDDDAAVPGRVLNRVHAHKHDFEAHNSIGGDPKCVVAGGAVRVRALERDDHPAALVAAFEPLLEAWRRDVRENQSNRLLSFSEPSADEEGCGVGDLTFLQCPSVAQENSILVAGLYITLPFLNGLNKNAAILFHVFHCHPRHELKLILHI
mmetsp:Transcript_63651/g.132511  ORF Transcript_63651/g.132511 Transcript_63651/m.132511 type:complete len:260 (+) Transcript_63651:834-1613(+)